MKKQKRMWSRTHPINVGRDEFIRKRRRRGENLQSIADDYGISRQRVFQILHETKDKQ